MDGQQPLQLPSHEFLARLARDNPPAYEALREALIARLIDTSPASVKTRLRGIQFRVDHLRRLSGSPLGATLRIYALMMDSLVRMNDGWQEMGAIQARYRGWHRPELPVTLPKPSARILPFRLRTSGERT
jgi:hypothetical protein